MCKMQIIDNHMACATEKELSHKSMKNCPVLSQDEYLSLTV